MSNMNERKYTLRDWQTIHKPISEIIWNASTKGGLDHEEKFPIGVSYKYKGQSLIGSHEKLALLAITAETDKKNNRKTSRKEVIELMKTQNIYNQSLEPSVYFTELPNYKFVISPAGNGTDCHRHYEALMAGCIPIVEYHPHILKVYGYCPILYTQDYSEITPEYLEQKYTEMIDRVFDFSRLFRSWYSEELQTKIRDNEMYYKYAILSPTANYNPAWMHTRSRSSV
jgi:hypothetical protein